MKFDSLILFLLIIILSLFLPACEKKSSDTNNQTSSKALFTNNIISILENRCLSCHGVSKDAYAQFMQGDNKGYFYFPVSENNTISDIDTTYQVSISHKRVEYGEDARFSHILRAPLTEEYGGIAHKGLDIFYSSEDQDYQDMLAWVATEIAEKPEKKNTLSKSTQFFKDKVQPVLVRNSCFLSYKINIKNLFVFINYNKNHLSEIILQKN